MFVGTCVTVDVTFIAYLVILLYESLDRSCLRLDALASQYAFETW